MTDATTVQICVDIDGGQPTIEGLIWFADRAAGGESHDAAVFLMCHDGRGEDSRVIQPRLPTHRLCVDAKTIDVALRDDAGVRLPPGIHENARNRWRIGGQGWTDNNRVQ